MKSFFTWIVALAIGGCIGYGLSFIFEVSLFLLIGIGVLVGSSLGVTINIHRDDDFEMPPDGTSATDNESEAKTAEKIT